MDNIQVKEGKQQGHLGFVRKEMLTTNSEVVAIRYCPTVTTIIIVIPSQIARKTGQINLICWVLFQGFNSLTTLWLKVLWCWTLRKGCQMNNLGINNMTNLFVRLHYMPEIKKIQFKKICSTQSANKILQKRVECKPLVRPLLLEILHPHQRIRLASWSFCWQNVIHLVKGNPCQQAPDSLDSFVKTQKLRSYWSWLGSLEPYVFHLIEKTIHADLLKWESNSQH